MKSPPPKPLKLLFISPVLPAMSGNGLSMRAGNLLRAWASLPVSIELLTIPVYEQQEDKLSDTLASRCQSYTFLPAPQPGILKRWVQRLGKYFLPKNPLDPPFFQRATPHWQHLVAKEIKRIDPQIIFIFRSYTAAFIPIGILTHYPHLLDLDEVDSHLLRRQHSSSAAAFADYENMILPKLSALTVASKVEREKLKPELRKKTWVLPNVYPAQAESPSRPADSFPYRALFIGNLNYQPNSDAVCFFVESILPEMLRLESRIQFVIVGANGPHIFRKWADHPHLEFTGWVENLSLLYAGVDLVVVPLRYGGGTRIKILEAFSYGKAVISTSIGSEGLDVTSGNQLLIANDPAVFAETCIRVLHNVELRKDLAQRGRTWFLKNHTPEIQSRLLGYWLQRRGR